MLALKIHRACTWAEARGWAALTSHVPYPRSAWYRGAVNVPLWKELLPHSRQEAHYQLQVDSAIEEGSAEYQVLPSGTIVETASGREGILFKRQIEATDKEVPLLPLYSLLYVCEIYQYSVGFLSALILLDFVIF